MSVIDPWLEKCFLNSLGVKEGGRPVTNILDAMTRASVVGSFPFAGYRLPDGSKSHHPLLRLLEEKLEEAITPGTQRQEKFAAMQGDLWRKEHVKEMLENFCGENYRTVTTEVTQRSDQHRINHCLRAPPRRMLSACRHVQNNINTTPVHLPRLVFSAKQSEQVWTMKSRKQTRRPRRLLRNVLKVSTYIFEPIF